METAASVGAAEGLDSITLISADGSTEAEFVPAANMRCCSFRYKGEELLHRGGGVRAYAEQGKPMGIPLLHPWANRLAGFEYRAAGKSVILSEDDPRIPLDPAGLPIHGVLPGLLRWGVEDTGARDTIAARLRWTSEDLLALFPSARKLRVDASVGRGELMIATSLMAAPHDPVPVSFGYHPYAAFPGSVVRLGGSRLARSGGCCSTTG